MIATFDQTPLRQHPYRWRLSRAGFVNVWHYYENTFDIAGGRLILRGTNGSGKSRALEMLLPFLLDADRRNMGTGSSVRMEDLMSAGAGDQGNRLGYMWLELRRDDDPAEINDPHPQYLTLGALVRFAVSTKEAKVWYFTTPLRVGDELPLLDAGRQPLSRRDLADLITEERITDVPEKHRERVRTEVFGLGGELGKERFDGLTKLLHTLRSPDVGNRIEEGRLPAILADALPPLSEDALTDAGQQLDGLSSTRDDQQRLEAAHEQIRTFLGAYRRYVTGVLASSLDSVRSAAGAVGDANKTTAGLISRATRLDAEVTAKEGRLGELREKTDRLGVRLDALRRSDAYRQAGELDRLSVVVDSLATTADTAFAAADGLRREEAGRVGDTAQLAVDVDDVASAVTTAIRQARELLVEIGLPDHGMPAEVRVDRRPAPRRSAIVRTSRDSESAELDRPVPDVLALVPADPAELSGAARRVADAARTRAGQAANRATDARALAEERREVDRAASAATDAEQQATDDRQAATDAAEARDDTALDLVDRWRTWIDDPATVEVLGIADWSVHPTLGLLLTDRTALCGDDAGTLSLLELDRAPDGAVEAAISALATELSRLADADAADRLLIAELDAERTSLRAARDPDPRSPAWVTASDGVPLWRCLDFAEPVTAEHRAGIEAALLASGLLTATVDADGELTADDGQLLVSPAGELARTSLASVLTVDAANSRPADRVRAILERIGYDDRSAPTWVGRDGSWGNGPLRGRHSVPVARHIGAAARAAARAARLAEIEDELATLARTIQKRQHARAGIQVRQGTVRERRSSAPRSMGLAQARTRATEAASRAGRSAVAATQRRSSADARSRAWTDWERAHRRACAEFGLPVEEESLRRWHDRAGHAARDCESVAVGVDAVAKAMLRFSAVVELVADVTDRRAGAERAAAVEWRRWREEATKLETLTEIAGAAASEVQRQVADAESALRATKNEFDTATDAVRNLSREAGTAAAEAREATARVAALRTVMTGQVSVVLDQLSQPGIVVTAFPSAPGPMFTELAHEPVAADASALLGALRRGQSDENALMRAQQVFEQAISGAYDVAPTVAAGIRIFELADAEGRRPLAQAAADIERQCEIGRAALTEREHQVFSRFVLGEVGEELRRRLGQASSLISAMNSSLQSIRTSHGIGVRLTWKLADEASGDILRIKELIATAAAVRTPAQDTELTGLLSARVAAEAVKEPAAGYAVHLRGALDYRAWHTVEVIITGPEEGRERRISRRAKLSQGETRFVSYVTLFAAVDAYLTGLESTAMSLRLILLDDAFAKVDEPTVAELLGLLVRLDVDFAMTGHALWGCVPQVPALDIYEICREDGTSAATAHVRWDGRNRHYLHAT